MPRALLLAVVLLGLSAACSDDSDPAGPSNAPASHTVVQSGVRHAPGLNSATQSCTSCHGSDLRGGTNGEPSCYLCHGRQWS